MQDRKFGWIPDKPDHRDERFAFSPQAPIVLPPSVDLRTSGFCPPVLDQRNIGSCVAFAIANADLFCQQKQGYKDSFLPSRLFIYYNTRVIEDTVDFDSGAMIRDGFKSIAKEGVCPAKMWPYYNSLLFKKPFQKCYDIGGLHQAITYSSVRQELDYLKSCLAEGYPFVFGFAVYESFMSEETSKTGIVKMPWWFEKDFGGHAVGCYGYDDSRKVFIVQNSWSIKWGDNGFFYMPYSYVANSSLSSDFWTVRFVENEDSRSYIKSVEIGGNDEKV